MEERRKEPRHTFAGSVKIGYDLDDLELCKRTDCDQGKVVTDGVAEDGKFILEECPDCDGRGFLPKKKYQVKVKINKIVRGKPSRI